MAARLHVGNLPYSVTEHELRQLFSQVGTVLSVYLPVDRLTGRLRGFAFVEMESSTEAEEAIRKFDGYSLDSRSLRVEIAKEREPRARGFGPPGGRRMGYGEGERREKGRQRGGRGKGWAA